MRHRMRKIGEDAAKELRDTGANGMETPNEGNRDSAPAEAEKHIKSAHQILKTLQQKIGEHPEIGAAITKLEMALNVLAVQTGGLL
jgi:hypothetical protein